MEKMAEKRIKCHKMSDRKTDFIANQIEILPIFGHKTDIKLKKLNKTDTKYESAI